MNFPGAIFSCRKALNVSDQLCVTCLELLAGKITVETQVRSLGQEDPLKEDMAIHSVFLPGESIDRSLVDYSPLG